MKIIPLPVFQKFSTSWDRIKNSRRVIIHIPSLGFTQGIRDTLRNFPIRQNTQMARLCDIRGKLLHFDEIKSQPFIAMLFLLNFFLGTKSY